MNLGAHPFVTAKYRLVKEKLIEENIFTEKDFVIPEIPDDDDILLVHTPEYFKKVKSVHLSSDEILRLEIPLTKEITSAGILCCGGTILACIIAIETGAGIHLGGGFHHAFPDHGEGFCVFNDLAVAIRKMQKLNKIKKALVIDCDLHQGNGTAYIFQKDTNVFTFSIHQEDIYPYPKQRSNVDIELSAGSGDEEYLELLRKSIPAIIKKHKPEIILYQAGADPYKGDQLGQLKLTID
ncbi:MAG: histone deacetylase, partial [Elusimicrobia bacterium CG_4_10_14_0_8_um_filter_37_32]